MSRSRLLLAAVVLGASLYAGFRPVGPAPALGPLLDPANGIWGLARTAPLPARFDARIPGLTAPVTVIYDDRGVPHVFAAGEEDAWRAQGFVVARDRLFQMELTRRATMGTLSELVGARAVEADRAARRRGFPWAVEGMLARLDSASLTARAARAYADGVNAWLAAMRPAELPVEYRLLDARPARWDPAGTLALFVQMGYTLAWEDETLERLQVRALVGASAADALLPLNSPIQEPIQPNGPGAPRYDFLRPFPPPGPPDTAAAVLAARRAALDLVLGWSGPLRSPGGDAIGSNNWVVGPGRTAAGGAILAGDPHLELTLPSIWYEIHLHAGTTDVAGVAFPGSPGVIIGFNRDVAWSFTNTGADVRDFYAETVDDDAAPSRYRLDGEWRALHTRVERVRGPGGRVLATDTIRFTHRGPLVREGGRWLSYRWTIFDADEAGSTFLRLDRARDADGWLEGWKDFVGPAQNGVVADRQGTIAVRSTGRYPLRPGDGRGDVLRDGSRRGEDWIGFVPPASYPQARNPAQGFLASANQQPVDPRANSTWFGMDWFPPWRAMRINQLLRADSSVTPDAMRRFQTDPGSVRADAFVPLFLEAARARAASGHGDDTLARAAALLAEWPRRYTRDDRRAVLFEAAMTELPRLLWDELIPAVRRGDTLAAPAVVPRESVWLELAGDSASAWWDDTRTAGVETRDALLANALRRGLLRTLRERGEPDAPGWLWANAHHANINHLLRLPSFSARELSVQGGPSTLSPSPGRGTHGPSWRMVVEMGPEARGWGIFPGGQSGNPASPFYLDRLPKWLAGELDTIAFPRSPGDLPAARVRSVLTLTGER